ncbi:MAG: Uma2 family endonuclease [Thermomicrobiales bacterium]
MALTATRNIALILEDHEGRWELHRGQLVERPGMSSSHNDVTLELVYHLRHQLPRDRYRVRVDGARLRRDEESIYIPDIAVVPYDMAAPLMGKPRPPEIYTDPVLLVVEVWSPSTGEIDLKEKLPVYQRRGDLEIWHVHPFDRTLTAWRRQPDGRYSKDVFRTGTVEPIGLPGVAIELEALFD